MRVLIVEDDEILRDGLAIACAALANAGMALSFEQLQPTGFRITAFRTDS